MPHLSTVIMETTNRSGLQCYEHPREEVTNFCVNVDCLKPLCPDCVQTHTKVHHKQDILSWRHCLSDAASKMKSTLQELRLLLDTHRHGRGPKTTEVVESQNLQALALLRQRYHRLIDDVFTAHEAALRAQIRQSYRFDQPDTSKLRVAVEEIQKVLMKLAHPASALPALKKALLLDQRALIDFFSHLRDARPLPRDKFFTESSSALSSIRTALERMINFEDAYPEPVARNVSSYGDRRYSNQMSVGEWEDPFEALRITCSDYFRNDCPQKSLHFFVPCSFELRTINLDEAVRGGSWQVTQFKARQELPCYFKSVCTPNGDIYLTGGSEEERRCRQIYRYNRQRNSLDFVCNMTLERSSHSICYLDNRIYLIGGFSGADGDVTRQCEVFDLQTQSCSRIAPLNTPSANSAAASFAGQFIFKFGGILNKTEGNSLIQMYSVRSNRWIVVNIESARGVPPLELLSFSAAVQINERDILVFGGYDNSELERPERLCYALTVWPEKNSVRVKNYNSTPLPHAEGFWNNCPVIYNRCVYALQNVTDQQDELTALADERRVVVFNGQRWL